jgi:hypothetical protein
MVFLNDLSALHCARLFQLEAVPDRQTQHSRDYNYSYTHCGIHFFVAGLEDAIIEKNGRSERI